MNFRHPDPKKKNNKIGEIVITECIRELNINDKTKVLTSSLDILSTQI